RESFCIDLNYRRLAAWCISAAMLAIISNSCLVTPINLCTFCLCKLLYFGICVIEPFLNSFRTLLVGFLYWLLWRKTPSLHVIANRSNGYANSPKLVNR